MSETEYYAAYDTNFTSGDSPATLEVRDSLSGPASKGEIINDGPGDLIIQLSAGGNEYGNNILLKAYDKFNLENRRTIGIKITHSGTDSAYRVDAE